LKIRAHQAIGGPTFEKEIPGTLKKHVKMVALQQHFTRIPSVWMVQ
jgi:hypothetical protein